MKGFPLALLEKTVDSGLEAVWQPGAWSLNDLFFLDLILKLEATLSCQQTAEHM